MPNGKPEKKGKNKWIKKGIDGFPFVADGFPSLRKNEINREFF